MKQIMHRTFSFGDVLMRIEPDLVLNQTGLQPDWPPNVLKNLQYQSFLQNQKSF
jgi:hypothetical protein